MPFGTPYLIHLIRRRKTPVVRPKIVPFLLDQTAPVPKAPPEVSEGISKNSSCKIRGFHSIAHFHVYTNVAGTCATQSQVFIPKQLASRRRPCQPLTRIWQGRQLLPSTCSFHIRAETGPPEPQGGPKRQNMPFFPMVLPLWANCPIWPKGGNRVKNA